MLTPEKPGSNIILMFLLQLEMQNNEKLREKDLFNCNLRFSFFSGDMGVKLNPFGEKRNLRLKLSRVFIRIYNFSIFQF